ncbi:hypothetical protein BB559_006404 [Furculomyces boomerangus]|uniref:GST N-terminal domain-containing protein n=1 Tax=Furculomyces boomerangus TaxID=61424 RepID=A0A2T9Y395_9FUNG|nr:hypothetical protein BB559_006404 [Furculomyces boomerangus]
MYPHSAKKLTVYVSRICPFANRAILSLHESGVDFKEVLIDLENKPEWYKEVNPALKVPALRLPNGKILVESTLIAEFVADSYPEANLLPKDPLERYEVRNFIEFYNSKVSPYFMQLLKLNKQPRDENAIDQKVSELTQNLRELNTKLKEHSSKGPHFGGSHFGFADIITFPFYERLDITLEMLGRSINNIKGLDRVYEWARAIRERESYKTRIAPRQDIAKALQSLSKRF